MPYYISQQLTRLKFRGVEQKVRQSQENHRMFSAFHSCKAFLLRIKFPKYSLEYLDTKMLPQVEEAEARAVLPLCHDEISFFYSDFSFSVLNFLQIYSNFLLNYHEINHDFRCWNKRIVDLLRLIEAGCSAGELEQGC